MTISTLSWESRGSLRRVLSSLRRSARLQLVAHRLLIAIPILFGVTLLTFFVLDVLPGNAARQLLGPEARPEQVAALEAKLGLNRPALVRYWEWLTHVARGDLGQSLASAQPVSSLVRERAPVSIELVIWATALSVCLAVPTAVLAAHNPNGWADRCITLICVSGLSIASFVLALLLVLVFSVWLGAVPSFGFVPLSKGVLPHFRSMLLPTVALAFPLLCLYTRILRGDLIEQMSGQDYVITALAKGLARRRVLIRHALRNGLFGLLTVVGLNFGMLFGGTVVVEQIFALPGIGQLLLQAIQTRDAPLVQSLVLLVAFVTVVANLAVDLLYTMLDPRIRYEPQ